MCAFGPADTLVADEDLPGLLVHPAEAFVLPAEGDGDVVDEEPGLKLAEVVDHEVAARAPGGIARVCPGAPARIPPMARPDVRAKGPALTDRPIYTTPPANLGGGGARTPPPKKKTNNNNNNINND